MVTEPNTETGTATTQLTVPFVTVRLDNKPGQLGRCCRTLGNANINIEGFSVDAGNGRFLVNDATRGADALKKAGFHAQTTDLFAIRLPNKPGQIATIGEELGKAGVNVECCFGVGGARESGRIFFQVNDVRKARPVFERLATVQATSGAPTM